MTKILPARRIVVGVDGTAAATTALLWAVREARLRRAVVHLVSACHQDQRHRAPYASPALADRPEGDVAAAAKAALDAAAELARQHLPPGRVIVELADELPARALLLRAAGAEMLVLGTSRRAAPGAGHRDWIGAVARVCVSKAPCPVVVVATGDVAGPAAA